MLVPSITRKKALFLHIQKSAGTSIVKMARKTYGRRRVISHDDFLELDYDTCFSIPFVSGHFGYAFAAPLMSDRFTFTFLRQPQDRLLSLYDFCRWKVSDDPLSVAAQQNTLEDFLRLGRRESDAHPEVKGAIWNNQVWQLATGRISRTGTSPSALSEDKLFETAVRNCQSLDYVGLTETFDFDQKEIFNSLIKVIRPRARHANAIPSKLRTSRISNEAQQLLGEMTELDQRLYDHVWAQRNGNDKGLSRATA